MTGISLNPLLHGRARVPGQTAAEFDLNVYARAWEGRDADCLLASYARDADVRIVDPDHPAATPRLVQGQRAIRGWLLDCFAGSSLRVTHLVDGGDRVAFTAHWHCSQGGRVVCTSTAELRGGLITTQHTLLVGDHH